MNNQVKKNFIRLIVNLAKLAWMNEIVKSLVILFSIVFALAYFGAGLTPDKLWNTRQTPPRPTTSTTPRSQSTSSPAPTPSVTLSPAPSSPSASPLPLPSRNQGTASQGNGNEVSIGQYSIAVAEGENGSTYDREGRFGPAWGYDFNGNGCDTRDDILASALQNTRISKDGCTVLSGTMVDDPYTGKTYEWKRGRSTSMAVQIDHIIPLKYAWMHGADKWTQEEREQYANDPDVLVAADGPANMAKGAKGPSQWEPENKEYTCTYADRWLKIADKYKLSVDKADAAWLTDTMKVCH